MAVVNRSNTHPPTGPLGLKPVVAGTACCVVSALGYTASNVCMRELSEVSDPMWAICIKESVAVAVVGPWLLCRALSAKRAAPPWRPLVLLAAIGLAVQLGANLGFQWALGQVGLAITVSVIFGTMLTASAVLGRSILGEAVSRRSACALGLLLVSLALLSLGAGTVHRTGNLLMVAAAVGAAGLAGTLYAVLTTTIRSTVTGTTPPVAVVLIITAMGVLSLGPLSVYRLGIEQLMATGSKEIAWMLAAGAFNLIAFMAITKGLQLTTVVHANVLNASQVAMAAVAGMLIFKETLNLSLIAGVGLTIVGVVIIERPGDGDQDADQHA